MGIYLNEHIEELDVERALTLVSEQRRQEALRYRRETDRRLSLSVYLLLRKALEKEYGITEPPQFNFGPHGKPMLADYPDIHFNLSHCPRAALCVVNKQPVGCDIEMVPNQLDSDLCQYCFNEAETKSILASPQPTLEFTRLWTRKEAYLKWSGEGLTANLPDLFSTHCVEDVHLESFYAQDRTYVYTICQRGSSGNGASTMICM